MLDDPISSCSVNPLPPSTWGSAILMLFPLRAGLGGGVLEDTSDLVVVVFVEMGERGGFSWLSDDSLLLLGCLMLALAGLGGGRVELLKLTPPPLAGAETL